MLPFKKIVGPDYKEGYKRTIHSKFLSTDPEVKKRFGVFKVTELLKNEDKQHFKNLYNYDVSIVEQYKLPEEKKEVVKRKDKRAKEKAKKEKENAERADLNMSVTRNEEDNQNGVRVRTSVLNLDNFQENTENDIDTRNLKEIFAKIFDPKLQKEEMKELEEELYEKKDSKTSLRLASVVNGEQAVQFFAMYGNTTPIKFIFCKRKEPGDLFTFRPYDLVRIEADQAKDDYFIITPTGISHVYSSDLKEVIKNKLPSEKYPDKVAEFYTLSDWMYQSTLFNILKRINYYKKYLSYKIFTIWRNYNRFKKFLNIRNGLSSKLFISKPAFVEKLITCNGQIYQMEKVELHKLVKDTPWSNKGLSDFDEEQTRVYDHAKSDFKEVLEKGLFDTLKSLYRSISTRLRETKDIDETENSKTLQELKNKSMYRLKLEKEMRTKLIKMASGDVELFERFIVMIDLMFVEKTYQLVKRNLKDMKNELYKERKKESSNSGIFTLTLGFADGSVSLVPTDNDMVNKFNILLKLMVKEITDVPRFISTMAKKDYEKIFFGDPTKDLHENERLVKAGDNDDRFKRNFEEVILISKYYDKFTKSIFAKLASEYQASVVEIKRVLEPFIQLEREKESWNVLDFLFKKPEIEEVKKRFEELKVWLGRVELLPASISYGIMNNNLQPLKEDFIQFIVYSRDVLEKDFIKKNYYDLKSELERDIREGNAVFAGKKVTSVVHACAYKLSLNRLSDKMTEVGVKVNKLNNLASIIKQFEIKSVPNQELSDFESLKSAYKEMEESIKTDDEEINRNKKNLLKESYDNMGKIKTKIKETNSFITSGIYLEVNTDRQIIEAGLKSIEAAVTDCVKDTESYNSYLKILGEATVEDEDLEKLRKNFDVRNKLWRSLVGLERDNEEWRRVSLNELKSTKIEDKIREFKTIGLTLSQSLSDMIADKVLDYFNDQVMQMEAFCPVVVALSSSSMQERNWKEIFKLIGHPFMPDSLMTMTLGDLLDKHSITSHIEDIESISAAAVAQERIQRDLDKIEKDWSVMKFVIQAQQQNNKASGNYIITTVEDIMTLLDEHSQLVASALGSRYLSELREKVTKWDEELNLISRIIEEWLMVQKQWIYLENIFSADDIKKQLEHANTLFTKVNKVYKGLMVKTYNSPSVIERCRQENLLDQLVRFNKELDIIQKSLEDYLQKKRAAFPRFYFLSNDELLKILSQTRNPRAVQDYLNKCFDGIKTINFVSDVSNEIIAMVSPENEEVSLTKTLFAHENIEAWLNDLEDIMFDTVYDQTKKCLEEYPSVDQPRKDWIWAGYPCQSVITVDQIVWANLVEKALTNIKTDGNALKNFSKYVESQIFELTELVSGKVEELKKSLVERLIIINVHARDVVKDLIKENVMEKNNFEWQKNLKFYWEMESGTDLDKADRCEVVIRQTNSRFIYGYEYLGNPERMVITPLTDKCYITLTSALHLNYGGAPAGPAGTGKTETTKDLSKALAIKVNVFNCTDQLDIQMMGRMFCGLAECGAWACFDEFNRIDVEVLSVIAQQIETIQSHLRSRTWNMVFEGKQIVLQPRFGVFITMNPGYAGRSELPDNLKSLFRPVAMMIPDYALVSEVTLYSKGFKEAKDLSIKMFQLFKLCSEQLSKQKHYDFGLRGIKSILSRAGYLKQRSPNDPEKEVLIRAMKDSNLPKFLDADIELFLDIIKDLFPKTVVVKSEDATFNEKVKEVLTETNLQHNEKLVEKVTQLLDTMMVRLGNMLVGATGTGKSTMYLTLAKTLTELGKTSHAANNNWYCPVLTNVLNPKSVTKFDLYMAKDEITQTWEDGIVAKLMRMAEEEEKEGGATKRRWMVFDGPVDALWIEDMNTVLDDSRKLCLPDSSNIRIPKFMNLIFEVQDLKAASPATVSRCGMVYIEPHHLGYLPIVETWALNYKAQLVKDFEEDYSKKNMKERIDSYLRFFDRLNVELKFLIPKILGHLRSTCKEKIPSTDVNLTQSCLNLITCFVNKEVINHMSTNVEELFNYYLAFSIIWSFGANIDDQSRPSFSKFTREAFLKINVNFDMNDIYDVFVNENGVFSKWGDNIKETFVYDKDTAYFKILVPTTDTVKYKYLIHNLNKFNYHSLITGETGVGKSVIVIDYLRKCEKEKYLSKSSNFSAKTTSKNVFDTLKSVIFKNGNFQPPNGKKFIYFIDDINLPGLDEYGSQQPIEFLRQLIDNKTFYDEKKTLKKIRDVIFMASCAPPSGGRNKVTPRLFRHFNMIWMTDLSAESMKMIFKSIVEGFLESSKSLVEEVDELMDAALELYSKIRTVKLPTPNKSHYTFNLRDLSKVVQGILQSEVKDLVDKKMLVNLWIHETSRQFRDRLLGDDTQWFDKEIADIYDFKFKLDKNEMIPVDKLNFTTIIDRSYRIVTDFEVLTKRINDALDMYNVSLRSAPMNLVFFTDAINHFCRICRIISQDRGNALLVGLGGSGRQSLTALVGSVLKYKINYLQVGKGYGVEAFWKDIGEMLKEVGTAVDKAKKQQIFLFSDTQILQESFLEDINNILNNGEVPNLFKDDDMSKIYNDLRDAAVTEGFPETKDGVYQYFVSNVRNGLHIVLCFSPVGEGFRNRCRQFPAIINCCTIDWFNIWPEEALKSVAARYLQTIGAPGPLAALAPFGDMAISLGNTFVKIQTKALQLRERFLEELRRFYYITPTSYLEFIKLFIDIYVEKIAIIPKEIQNYKLGIGKLEEANIIVKNLKEELVELQPKQVQKKAEVEELIEDLDKKTKLVEVERGKMKADFDVVDKKRNEIFKVKEECDFELSKAKPELDKAKAALAGLDEGEIRTVKGYPNPSENIVNLAKTICYIFDAKTEYSAFKTVVGDPSSFIRNCQDEDAMIKKLNDPRKLRELGRLYSIIEPVNYASVNQAAVGLKIWVGALLKYIETFRIVKPKMESLDKANKELKIVEAELFEKSKVLREKEDELNKLQSSFDEANRQLKALSDSIHNISVKQTRAVRLVDGLKEEGKRWKEKISLLEKEEKNLLANVILSAAVVSYSGPFTTEYRKEFINSVIGFIREENINYSTAADEDENKDKNASNDFNVQDMLSDPMQIREWIYAGLPADDLSIENAIITVRSKRWPLIIDPQMQANKWIKNFYRNAGIKSYKLTDKTLFNRLKDCIVNGYPCLIENVESSLDSSLEPILQKQVYKSGAAYYLSLGGKEAPIMYSQTFKLFMTSKLANPHYLPEVSIKVTLINFTVTVKGLEDQLLVEVVKNERPDLESQKDALVLSINENKKAIKDLEQTILNMVKDASTEILENDHLVNKLDQSKVQSVAIKEDLEKAETTAKKINKERRAYRPIAVRGSILYFVIASLANIDSMYNYSLEYFAKLFNQRLHRSEANSNVTRRVEILIDDITVNFFEKISRGLFEKDKLLYSFLIFINIALDDNKISTNEWSFFLRGGETNPNSLKIDETHSYHKNSINSFMDISTYRNLLCLRDMSVVFYDMENMLNANSESEEDKAKWREFMTSDNPHLCHLPSNIEGLLNSFYRLVLVKVLREEKLIFAIKHYISDKKFLETPPFNIATAYEDSMKNSPLIFILSPGANPVKFLRSFASEKNIRMMNISLGRGQGDKAKAAILNAKDSGDWVCLENCHLAKSWMPFLEEILEDINDNESAIHSNYRLWLTSMPSEQFPVSILQTGLKITNEPPKGIRANLKGTFQNMKEEDIITRSKSFETGKMLFSLAFFHAIILERRKFGPLGWNIPYEWMNSDFDASKLHVKMYIEDYAEVPYKILQYLVGVINYGGRVTDDKDAKLISAILGKYFNDLVLDNYYKYSDSGVYYAPKIDNFGEIVKYLDTLPLDDEPEVFGLHPNANITLQNKLVREFMDPLISIQPRSSQSGTKKPDDEVLDLKNEIADLFKRENITLLDLKNFNPVSVLVEGSNKKSPLGNFLLQESDKFNNLISIIKSSLANLDLAVKGLIVMSPDIEKIYFSFLTKTVPKMWEDNAYLSLKPLGSWAADLAQRIKFMSQWLIEGPPKSFWISAFFFPQGFNTAVLQTYARSTNIPIDVLTFNTNVLKHQKDDTNLEIPKVGLNIHGIFLQGASWNSTKVNLKEPDLGELSCEMPCIWLEPIQVNQLKKNGYYECPLYKTSRRAGELSTTGHSTNFVMYFYLKSEEETDHWIRRGAALLTQLDN